MEQQIAVKLILPEQATGTDVWMASPPMIGDGIVYTDGQQYTVSAVTVVLTKVTAFKDEWEEAYRIVRL